MYIADQFVLERNDIKPFSLDIYTKNRMEVFPNMFHTFVEKICPTYLVKSVMVEKYPHASATAQFVEKQQRSSSH